MHNFLEYLPIFQDIVLWYWAGVSRLFATALSAYFQSLSLLALPPLIRYPKNVHFGVLLVAANPYYHHFHIDQTPENLEHTRLLEVT
jgi:hypothetical protein